MADAPSPPSGGAAARPTNGVARGNATPIAVGTAGGRRPRRWPRRSPLLVLLVSLLLTAATSLTVWSVGRSRDRARFDNAVQATTEAIGARLRTYEGLLYGARGLFVASEDVRADDFRRFVGQLQLLERYPGIQGVGYSRWLNPPGTPATPAALAAALVRGGSPATQLAPATPRAEYHAIVYLEPHDERNAAALGYDMASDPTRRAAMARARDSGLPAASGMVTLRQEIDARRQAGFLVYLPVYAGGAVPDGVAERRTQLRGFVYAPFRGGDFLAGLFGRVEAPRVSFRVYDAPRQPGDSAARPAAAPGPGRGPAAQTVLVERTRAVGEGDTLQGRLLADSRRLPGSAAAGDEDLLAPDGSAWQQVVRMDVFGRRWTLVFTPGPGAALGGGTALAAAIALLGVLISLGLAALTASEVRAREQAERSDALRARFFAAMSHELRTPINAILGYNDLLLAGIYGPVAPAQVAGIERAQRAARHLLELVNDVLDLSKLEAGKVDVHPEPVPLDTLLDDLLATIRPMAAERGCTLALEGSACGLTVETDPRRLRQILLNLLSNATKFGAGHPVILRCHAVQPGTPPPGRPVDGRRWRAGDGVVIEVADAGPGIAAHDQDRIFEEFVQLPGSSSGGTGLGLPISRRLAEALGGSLWVRSHPGHGATFSVALPLRPPRLSGRQVAVPSRG